MMNIDRAALQRKHQKEQLQAEQAFKLGLIKNEQREEILERHEKEAMEWKIANFKEKKVGCSDSLFLILKKACEILYLN